MNAEPQEKDVVIRALGDQPGTQLDRTDLVFGTVEPRPVRPEGRASRIIIGAAGLDDDVDLDEVVEPICLLKFRNAGQVCTSPTRFYVAESIFEEFVERFVAVARGLKVGDPLSEDDIDVGPLIGAHRVDAIDRLVNEAVDQGAKLVTGGQRGAGRNIGFYYDPTVLTNVPKEAAIMREEPFGPVALINPVSGFTEGICEANATDYGLAAYAYSRNPAHLDLARAKLEF